MADMPVKAASNESLSVSRRFMVIAEFCSRIKHSLTSKMDQSTSDQLRDLTVFASLVDRQSPSLPKLGIHTRQERGRRALFRPAPPPPYAYAMPAFRDRARYHQSSRSLRADRRCESSYTFFAGDRKTPTLLHSRLR